MSRSFPIASYPIGMITGDASQEANHVRCREGENFEGIKVAVGKIQGASKERYEELATSRRQTSCSQRVPCLYAVPPLR
jgi:hypothetical protein